MYLLCMLGSCVAESLFLDGSILANNNNNGAVAVVLLQVPPQCLFYPASGCGSSTGVPKSLC